MSRPMIRIHDSASDEVTDREMTDAEYTAYMSEEKERTDKAARAAIDKSALLAKLGITADEFKTLLG